MPQFRAAGELAAGYDPDFMIFEEVDLKATRSYHVDEYELLDKYFGGYYSDFAIIMIQRF